MDWSLAKDFGLPGFLMIVIGYVAITLGKLWIASNERVQLERVKVEDKRADATVAALTTLGGKIDSHHTTDIQSHSELSRDIGELHGKIDQALVDRTPVEGAPVRRATPSRGVPAGEYSFARPKTGGGR